MRSMHHVYPPETTARMPAYPTIVVPGITATYFHDEYRLPPEAVWSVLTRDYARASLHPDDLRYEAAEPSRLVPGQIYEVAYKELIEELRFNLRATADEPVPVFAFGYDWRQPLEAAEIQLARFIEEVIARTRLLKHYDRARYPDDPKVNLVGHSMGGLIIAGYLERAGVSHRVHKVATLAAPFQGSLEAVVKITTGTANLGRAEPSSREREAARMTPALYQLLPSFAGGLDVEDGLPGCLFDAGLWQPSIVETLKEYIRLHGLRAADRDRQAQELFTALLASAARHRARLDGLDLSSIGLAPERWLCVVGVDVETRVRLSVTKSGGEASFRFRAADLQNKWSHSDNRLRRHTGDGTVPFEGAVPRFLPLEALVCVTGEDFGYWEVQDKLYAQVAGFHGILPNMDMLHRMIVAHFRGTPAKDDNIWGQPAPGVQTWTPPVAVTRTRPH